MLPQFGRMLFNIQITTHYNSTFSVQSVINQYQSINLFHTKNYTQIKSSSFFVRQNVILQPGYDYSLTLAKTNKNNQVKGKYSQYTYSVSFEKTVNPWFDGY